MRPTCASCRFSGPGFAEDDHDDPTPVLLCGRYPPSLFVLGGQVTQAVPQVHADDWCGEHEPEVRRL